MRASPSQAAPRPAWLRLLPPAVIVALTFVAFLPVLDAGFVSWDDETNLLRNPRYRGLGWSELRWMFTTTLLGHYTPVSWISHGVDYTLWGMNPRGYHLDSLVIHALSAGLFYFVARRLLQAGFGVTPSTAPSRPASAALSAGAAFAALVFGVHPLRVESVAWLTERQDVLCGLFYLIAVLAYLRGLDETGTLALRWSMLSCSAFLLALLSKAAAMPLPAALVLLDVYPLRRPATVRWRTLLVEKVPYVVLAALISPVALIAQAREDALASYTQYGIGARLAMTAYGFTFYPRKFAWGADLSPLYELPSRIDPLALRFLAPTVAFIVVTFVLFALRTRVPALLAAWVYSALLVLPVSGMVHTGAHLVADRFSYLSGLGFAVLAGAALVWVVEKRDALRPLVVQAAWLAAALIIVVLMAGSWRQSKIWHDSETLWRAAWDADPACVICAVNLGAELAARPSQDGGRSREAEALFRRAIALDPTRMLAYHGLGLALMHQGRYPEAEAAFGEYARRAQFSYESQIDFAQLYLSQRRYAEAIPFLRRAAAMRPPPRGLVVVLVRALRARGEELRREGLPREGDAYLVEAAALEATLPASGGTPAVPAPK